MHELSISPHGHLLIREVADEPQTSNVAIASRAIPDGLLSAYQQSPAHGMLVSATEQLDATLPAPFEFVRGLARRYFAHVCRVVPAEPGTPLPPVPAPDSAELEKLLLQAPPMTGLEYLTPDVLADWWHALDKLTRAEIARHKAGAQAYLRERNPEWRFVGRVTFHLAENKRDPERPFAFLATYAGGLTTQGKVRHEPLARALQEYAGAQNRAAMLNLLLPVSRAAERSELIRNLVDTGEIYQPLAWTARDAYPFLQAVPALEESGLIVRVPDWWNARTPSRARVSVKIDTKDASHVGVDALMQFSVGVSLDGETLSREEMNQLLAASGGLVPLRGKWVEIDANKLKQALAHWKQVEQGVQNDGLSFFEGMRLLSGAHLGRGQSENHEAEIREWTGLAPGPELERVLQGLRAPTAGQEKVPAGLKAQLRPYQQTGYVWLRFVARLGLGACLADDMGLGKTVQVISLLLDMKQDKKPGDPASLLVVPASLIANWKAELERFAPGLTYAVVHPSELGASVGDAKVGRAEARTHDLVLTTYGMVVRNDWMRKHRWRLVVLDEAQAIKNSGTRQTKAVKELTAGSRIAMTGTPVENRLSDLWSLFDFLNPGLLGTAKQFSTFVKRLQASQESSFEPLRTLVRPYILRRLKTDKRVISDLPDKTELKAYCNLSKLQASLYQKAVEDLEEQLESSDGMKRRGIVLAQLMRLKQICNHPSQVVGTGDYAADKSGKFARLAELAEEIAARQEKVLVFSQFREITEPLAEYLATLFGRPGLVLHGGTSVKKRQELVNQFQQEDGPPFFVLSLKAGGTGLNLTAASHVIHFDRWWNPAIENQATDRAFRIGQKKNVLVHKFICRGTVEEKIDEMITIKSQVASDVMGEEGAGEMLLTEMDNATLMRFVKLDLQQATDG